MGAVRRPGPDPLPALADNSGPWSLVNAKKRGVLISAFARASGLSVDTVRFYVRRGLLHPEVGRRGGSRPYRVFSTADLERARIIRIGQALGLSLKEIRSFSRKAPDEMSEAELRSFITEQRGRLALRIAELRKLVSFLDAKLAWIDDPDEGEPAFPG